VTLSDRRISDIRNLAHGKVTLDAALCRFTSFRIGGPADVLVEPDSVSALAQLLRYLHEEKLPRMILGAGTNVLFPDAGFRGIVVRTAGMRGLEFYPNGCGEVRIVVAAGEPLASVVARSCRHGWAGMESLWGIPGSFGGAVVTNAGAGGTSVGELLEDVTLLSGTGTLLRPKVGDLRFKYRSMELPAEAVVVEGSLRLHRGDPQTIAGALERSKARRRSSQPLSRPSAGCIFKNPVHGDPAGAIIDRLGFKGMKVGDAQVSERHANFIINTGRARAEDVMALIVRIRSEVMARESIGLDLEIRVIEGAGGHG
jgi:UDP-N-acetylmuramate dehydrogenase